MINRDNGWSLKGLYKSLKAQEKNDEAETALKRFEQVWTKADIEIESSIL